MLKAHKSEYLVSNNPGLLEEDDILLSPGTGGEVLLKILCDYEHKVGQLEVLQADRPILVGEIPVRNTAALADGDTIRIDTGQILRCNFAERIIEEERNIISTLEVRDLNHRFREGETAMDGISFTVTRGEMVCVMGASGCGKSTLMRVLAGQLQPQQGEVLLNEQSLYADLDALRGYIAYIPQEDAFDEHLTIEENLTFAAAIRAPHLTSTDRSRRIDGKLVELGLSERRNNLVGSQTNKTLSGGERKRLNIGLDMIGSADVFLFDEPTSGLSSKDAEHVIEIIRSMAHNKIVLVTIHQPTSKLFQLFSKAMLLDKGGKLVFYGTPHEMLEYFAAGGARAAFRHRAGGLPGLRHHAAGVYLRRAGDAAARLERRHHLRGKHAEPARAGAAVRPGLLAGQVRVLPPAAGYEAGGGAQAGGRRRCAPAAVKRREGIRWRDEWTQLRTLLKRAFISKFRIYGNLLMTIVEAPLLAALIGAVLRYSANGALRFRLGLPHSHLSFPQPDGGHVPGADEFLRRYHPRPHRAAAGAEPERAAAVLHLCQGGHAGHVRRPPVRALRAHRQCHPGNPRHVLDALSSSISSPRLAGIALGLVISSLVEDGKTAANVVPLILIPNIILGGALIKYEDMNRDLDLIYRVQRWVSTHPSLVQDPRESDMQVPIICEFVPDALELRGAGGGAGEAKPAHPPAG